MNIADLNSFPKQLQKTTNMNATTSAPAATAASMKTQRAILTELADHLLNRHQGRVSQCMITEHALGIFSLTLRDRPERDALVFYCATDYYPMAGSSMTTGRQSYGDGWSCWPIPQHLMTAMLRDGWREVFMRDEAPAARFSDPVDIAMEEQVSMPAETFVGECRS